MSDLKFKITAQSTSPARTIVKARNFEIIVDEPKEMGGSNTAANPVEYVLAAFAGCLNVMGHLIAGEMGFELRGLEIDIAGDLNPAKLFGKSDEDRAGYKNIVVMMKPDCNADEATLEKWMHTVEQRCPVSDNIQNTTPVQVMMEKFAMA
ncbi:MAG: OsmC family protein [Bacteroidales bacterium]|nr:OsmC family protein [Bacteroidales bacterium]